MNKQISSLTNSISNFLFFLSLIIPMAVILMHPNAEKVPLIDGSAESWSSDWYYYDTEQQPIAAKLPKSLPTVDGVSIIHKKLPVNVKDNEYLCLWSSQKNLSVFVDGNKLYSYTASDFPDFLRMDGFLYHMIPLSSEHAGKELSVSMAFRLDDSGYTTFRPAYYGTQSEIIFEMSRQYGVSFLASFLLLFLSVIILILGLVFRQFFNYNYSLLYIGLFSFLISLWFIFESRFFQVFVTNPLYQVFYVYLTLMLVPFPLSRFLNTLSSHDDWVLKVFELLSVTMAAVYLCLQLLDIVDLTQSKLPMNIMVTLFSLYTIFYLARGVHGKRFKLTMYLPAFSFLVLGTIAEVIHTNFIDSTKSPFLELGMMMFVILLCVNVWQQAYKQLELAREAEYYQQLAMTDMATGVKNRTAFYEVTENTSFKPQEQSNTVLTIFDLNNLKTVNDTLGHLEGDRLIASFAKHLRQEFENFGDLYRIGGDEFVMLSNTLGQATLDEKLINLAQTLRKAPSGHPIEFAYGYKYFKATSPTDYQKALQHADEKMYTNKSDMKQ